MEGLGSFLEKGEILGVTDSVLRAACMGSRMNFGPLPADTSARSRSICRPRLALTVTSCFT